MMGKQFTGVPQSLVVIREKERVLRVPKVFQEAVVVVPKLTPEQGLEKVLFDHLLRVVVEGLEVVEGARVLVQELPEEGGPAPVGGRYQDVPHLVAFLGQQRVAQSDRGEIQRFSQLIS